MKGIAKEMYGGIYNGKTIRITITEDDMVIRADDIQPYPLIPDGLGLTYEAGEDFMEIHYPVKYDTKKKWERMERMYKFLVMSFGTGKVEHDFAEIFPEASLQSAQ